MELWYMWLFLAGSKDYNEKLGYVVTTCPECRTRGLFKVEQERKKFTVYLVPTFQYSKKQYMTCPACQETFEAGEEIKEELTKRLITQEELTKAIRNGRVEKLLSKKGRTRKKS